MDDLTTLAFWSSDLPLEDQELVEQILREQDALSLFRDDFDVHSIVELRRESLVHQTKFRALLDLNTLRDILSMSRSDKSRGPKERRFAAALILFFQLTETLVEPSVAIHESPDQAQSELNLLRQIDNADYLHLVRVLKDGREQILPAQLPRLEEETLPPDAFANDLKGSLALKTALTKVAVIDRTDLSPTEKVKAFMDWTHFHFIHVREAIHLCFLQFAPGSEKRLIKSINSQRTERVRKGVQNAVYDLLLARDWVRRCQDQKKTNTVWILASRDRQLARMARMIMQPAETDSEAGEMFEQQLKETWTSRQASELLTHYLELKARTGAPERESNRVGFDPYHPRIQQELEKQLLS